MVSQMPRLDAYGLEVLKAFEKGKLKSVATKSELARLKAAARATAIKDRRVNTLLQRAFSTRSLGVPMTNAAPKLPKFCVLVVAVVIASAIGSVVGHFAEPQAVTTVLAQKGDDSPGNFWSRMGC
jgi:hypothetical protein